MATTNSVTGDSIMTKIGDKEARQKFEDNFDAIFRKKKESDDWNEERMDVIGQNGNDGIHYNEKV